MEKINQKVNKGTVSVIVPPVVVHNLDPHTGIPFMPHMAASLAGALDRDGYKVQIIDCFGLQPHQRRLTNDFMFLGVDENWVVENISQEVQVVFLYCKTVEDLVAIEKLMEAIRLQLPKVKIVLFENIQSVNSFSMKHIIEDLFEQGCHVAIMGEPENRADQVIEFTIQNKPLGTIPGIAFKNKEGGIEQTQDAKFNRNLDELPLPLWEKFPLNGYWDIGFAHAPVRKEKFLPILTSRGCPYRCTFCVAPEVNPKWRSRSAKNIADEMEYFYNNMGITDYHISDFTPTVNDRHTQDICRELIARKLPISWKVAQGTKIETIKSEKTLELMAEAGCNFMAFAPESGSPRMLKIMNKAFDHDYGLKMVSKMNELGIRSQACFILGVPGENNEDRKQNVEYVKKLVKAGLDELAAYIFTPLPGAKLSQALEGYTHYSQCTRSPDWRKDYKDLLGFRRKMYFTFFFSKLAFPKKLIREFISFLTGNFQTKMEMSIYKLIKLRLLYYFPYFFKKLDATNNLKSLNSN